jgi:hypothetical protein
MRLTMLLLELLLLLLLELLLLWMLDSQFCQMHYCKNQQHRTT